MGLIDPKKHLPEHFAAKLRAARADRSMEGERRVVTILFCDVVGSTAIAEQLDPEEWAEIMNECFEYMIAPVYHYEGTVARLMGDSILAFFGAPLAHEDDPQRAILAGLEIIEGVRGFRERLAATFGIDLNVRVGINTGKVVVGRIGTDYALEYTAMGDAVNLAARTEQTAAAGTIQVTEETFKFAAPFFEFEPLGGLEVRGKKGLVNTFRVKGIKEQPARQRGIQGLAAPLTGRDMELSVLREAIEAVWKGESRIVFLVGEAGLGKSRLIQEIRGMWEENANFDDTWLGVRGISYEQDQPFGLVSHYFRQRFGIAPQDTSRTMHNKIINALDIDPGNPDFEVIVEAFIGLIDPYRKDHLPGTGRIEGEELKRKLSSSVINIFRQSLSLTPLAFVIDDLQWVDPASIELTRSMFKLTDEFPALFLCATRPNLLSSGWQLKQAAHELYPHLFSEVVLNPLPEEDSNALVDGLLDMADLSPGLKQLICQKAEGNPFFVEEIIRTLIDNRYLELDKKTGRWSASRPVEVITIPDNVLALLTARIDRLSENARRTLQIAAVIGRTFKRRLLDDVSQLPAQVIGDHLSELSQAGLVLNIPAEKEETYTFRHDLTRDAAYHSLLHRQRRKLHGEVASGIERQSAGRLTEEASRLAYHFSQAGLAKQAVAYHLMAAEEAARLFAHSEAITHYRSALDLAKRIDPDQVASLFLRLGRALELASRFTEALETYREMARTADTLGDTAMGLKSLIHQGLIYSTPTVEFNYEKGASLAKEALARATALGDISAQAQVHWNQVNLYRLTNRWVEGRQAGERAVELARQLGDKDLLAAALNDLSHVYMSSLGPDAASGLLREAASLWRELGNQPRLADTIGTMSLANYMRGDFKATLDLSERANRISRSINNPWGQSYSLFMIGDVYWERGEVDRAIASLEDSIEYAEEAGFLVPQVDNRAFLGLIYGYLGDYTRGLALAEEAMALADQASAPYLNPSVGYLAELHVVHGKLADAGRILAPFRDLSLADPITSTFSYSAKCRLYIAQGAYQEALDLAEGILNLIRPLGYRLFIPKILFHKGEALRGLGQYDAARASLRESQEEAHAIGSIAMMWLIFGALAELEALRGEKGAAEKLRQEASAIINFIAENISDIRLRNLFLAMPNVIALRLP